MTIRSAVYFHLGTSALAACLVLPVAAYGQTRSVAMTIPAQDLGSALKAIAAASGEQIIFRGDVVRGKRSNAVQGSYSAERAIAIAIDGQGLLISRSPRGVIMVIASAASGERSSADEEILVTGSRIRGGVVASKTSVQTQDEMRQAGFGTMAEVIRTIPQNFGGGQNAGISAGVPEGNGNGYGAASSINLRGLGSDATLTLLNGHRLAYNFAFQAVDVSQIPFEAIDRIEVVPDGSSALYGSDAVGGVANILLKRDYEGLKATARLGASTDGGNEQQQYSAVAGSRWDGGGIILSGEYGRTTPIRARERSYSAERSPGLFLLPFLTHHNLLASGHQDIGESFSLSIDALYNRRKTRNQMAFDDRGDPELYGQFGRTGSKSFVVAPSLRWDISADGWQADLSGMMGSDRTFYQFDTWYNGAALGSQAGCYCNASRSADIAFDGPLFQLPGGKAKLAIGGGYRLSKFHGFRTSGTAQDIRASQDAYFAYGELALPLAGPAQEIAGLHRFDLTGALRYEKYPDVDDVLTPKLGMVYAPVPDLDIRATWGRSFRAPTLYQQYSLVYNNAYLVTRFGGTGYAADAQAIIVSGGNRDLKPERARTWSATLDFHPRAIEGLRIELSYFNAEYRDRIVTPIQYSSQSLSNALYARFVDLAPTRAEIDAVLADADVFSNVTGGTFDPDKVVAIINNTNINVSRQSLRGIDLTAQYRLETAGAGTFDLKLDASRLDSEQVTLPGQAGTQLSGTLYNPPKIRGRTGLVWTKDGLGLGLFANHTGKLRDTRNSSNPVLDATTTIDATIRFTMPPSRDVLGGTDLVIGVQNMFNVKPPFAQNSYVFDTPYDSTNYNAVGRFVSVSLSKSF